MIAISIFFYRSNISYFNFFHIKYFVFVSVAGNFHHSDCIGGGGGSAESPYNNISSAQSQRGGPPLLFTMIWPIANMIMRVTVMTIIFFCVIPINSS